VHVTYIKPKIGRQEKDEYVDEGRMEPLQLGVLAGMAPPDTGATLFDDRFEQIDFDRPTDLVALTVETFTARRAYEIAAEYRRRGVPVVMGGMHPTLIPEEVSEHADSVFIGDGETTWSSVVKDAEDGRLKSMYRAAIGAPQIGGTPVRRDLFEGKRYLPVSLLQFSRGCPYECRYCATSAYFGHSHFCRSIEDVVAEIRNQDRRILFFVDDNLTADHRSAKELMKALIPLKVYWAGQLSIDVVGDTELLDLMKRSGCLGFVVGFESLSMNSLREMNKTQNTYHPDRYESAIHRLQDKGFQIWAAFTLGHDSDTRSSLEDTVAFALKHKFTFAAFNILLPYPNTALYQDLACENRLLYDGRWWLHDDYRFNKAAFVPKNMTAAELTEIGRAARREFNSLPSLLRRASHVKTNLRSLRKLGMFAYYSLLFRREVKKKEGLIFGETSPS
jgi:radical SAM superfamily enzyme YgiQ (UPF0313 family)